MSNAHKKLFSILLNLIIGGSAIQPGHGQERLHSEKETRLRCLPEREPHAQLVHRAPGCVEEGRRRWVCGVFTVSKRHGEHWPVSVTTSSMMNTHLSWSYTFSWFYTFMFLPYLASYRTQIINFLPFYICIFFSLLFSFFILIFPEFRMGRNPLFIFFKYLLYLNGVYKQKSSDPNEETHWNS